MVKMNFIRTSDEDTRDKLINLGFTFLQKDGKFFCFLNDGKQVFNEDKKIIYTDKVYM